MRRKLADNNNVYPQLLRLALIVVALGVFLVAQHTPQAGVALIVIGIILFLALLRRGVMRNDHNRDDR